MDYENIALNLNPGVLLYLLFLVAAALFTFFVYRFTVPRVSDRRRFGLIGLRASAIATALFVLFEPILSLTAVHTEKPILAVALDQSVSMTIVDRKTDRRAEALQVAGSPLFSQIADTVELRYFTFNDSAHTLDPAGLDSLDFSGNATSISQAMEQIRKDLIGTNYAGLLIISDGQSNLGVNPERFASFYEVPIFTVGIGDPSEQKDITISRILTNDIAYAESEVPVDVHVAINGFEGKRVEVQLKNQGILIDSEFLEVGQESAQMKTTLRFVPKEEGVAQYEVVVPQLEGELTGVNNRRTFFVRVLKNKTRVLIVSGAPDPEVTVLYNTMLEDENINVSSHVQKADGTFLKNDFESSDGFFFNCIVFNNFPTRQTDPVVFKNLSQDVVSGQLPLLFIHGPQTDLSKAGAITGLLPAEFRADADLAGNLVYLEPSAAGRQHPVVRLSDDLNDDLARWQALPPIFAGRVLAKPLAGSEVLARVDMGRASNVVQFKKDIPMIISRQVGSNKTLALSGSGWWRLKFLMIGANRTDDVYRNIVSNSIRWLVTRDDEKKVRITTSKRIYRTGEKIEFSAQVYDQKLDPVDGAEIKVSVKSGEKTFNLLMNGIGQGRYEASLDALLAGDYSYSGAAIKENKTLGADGGKFTVEAFSLEFFNTRMNEKLLRGMAQNSGGQFFTTESFGDIVRYLDFETVSVKERDEVTLWNKTPLLILFVVLVSAEWFIRKRSGML